MDATTAEDATAIVRRFIEQVLNEGEIDVADELVATDFVSHGWRQEEVGRESVKRFAAEQRADAPDWHIEIHDIVAQGDRVAVRATGSGTRRVANDFIPRELVGQRIAVDWIAIYRVTNGRIAERWAMTSPAQLA